MIDNLSKSAQSLFKTIQSFDSKDNSYKKRESTHGPSSRTYHEEEVEDDNDNDEEDDDEDESMTNETTTNFKVKLSFIIIH
jgi:hypothetical protein